MQQYTLRLFASFGVGLILASCLGPIEPNPDHCFNQDGNDFCAEKYGDERRFCGVCDFAIKDGCAAERPSEASCYSPCGDAKSLEDDPACDGVAEGSSSSDTESATEPTGEPTESTMTMGTGSMSTSASETDSETESESSSTTVSGCTMSGECADAASPICVEMECVPCSADAECLDRDPGLPACRDDGQCVACTPSNASACGDTTPVCNPALNECEGCGFHEQCAGTACDIATGACFEDDCVNEVDGDPDAKANYTNIQAAIADGCVVIVHELDGADVPYVGAVDIDGLQVALLAAPGEDPIVLGTGGAPSLNVTNGAVAYVQGLTFSGNTMAVGITADASSLYLDRAAVVGNTGGGISLTGGAYGQVRNCFVGGNVNDVVALALDGANADVLYSTIIAADQFGDGAALACAGAESPMVRNSLVAMIGAPPEIQCGSADVTYSATEGNTPGTGNVALGNVMPGWFVSLTNDFHLTNPPDPVLTAAQWNTGDPAMDIDGNARPDVDGTADVAGAHAP